MSELPGQPDAFSDGAPGGELGRRLARLFAAGHEAAPPALWIDPRIHEMKHFTPASVLVAITDRLPHSAAGPGPGLLLIHRPDTMRAHPGQIAFPGGRRDPGEDAIGAALREAEEELGIPPAVARIIGPSDLYRTGSGYEITPVIALVPADLALVPNPTEVASWFEAPLDHVLNPANHHVCEIEVQGEHGPERHHFIEIHWREHRIWGVTAAILANLAQRLQWCIPQGCVPQGSAPQECVPQGCIPQGIAPQGCVPQGSVPQGSVPQAGPADANA